jgi:hypothetical protein
LNSSPPVGSPQFRSVAAEPDEAVGVGVGVGVADADVTAGVAVVTDG